MAKNRRYVDTLYPIAEAQLGYFTAAQAREADLHPAVLAQLAKRDVLERVSRGVYRLRRYPSTPLDSLMEAVLWPQVKSGSPAGVISHESALAFHGMSDVSPSKIHVTVPADARIRRDIPSHIAIHHATLRSDEVRRVEAIPVTTPERSLRDAAASHIGRALLRQGIDDGVRSGVLTADQARRLAHELLEDPRVAGSR